jgi:hypothetical protein
MEFIANKLSTLSAKPGGSQDEPHGTKVADIDPAVEHS